MKNKPKSASRPKKQTKSKLKKTPAVKAALLGKKNKPAKKTGKNKIGTLDNANLHKMEMELRETKERLRLLSEAAEEGIAIHDKGIIVDANDALARIFGYELSEMIGMKAERLTTPESWKVIKEHISKKYDKPYESVGVRKDGSTFICSLLGKPYKYKGRTLRLSAFRDITDLRKMEEKYRNILENIQEGYFEVDIAGNYTFLNDSMCLIHGYSKKELMGMNNRQYTEKEVAKKVFKGFNRVYKTGKPLKYIDWQIIRKDGVKRYIEASVSLRKDSLGNPIGFKGIIRDITERKQAEEKLRSEEQRFRALVEQSSDIIVFVNREGIVTYENQAIEKLLGFKPEERIGVKVFDRIHPDDLKFARDMFNKFTVNTSSKDINSPVRQIRVRHQDGSWRTFETKAIKLIHNNIVETVIVNLRDVSEHKKAESQREAALEALQESEHRLRAQYNGNPIPTFTWQKQGDEFILTDLNDRAKIITGNQWKTFLGRQASEMYKSRQDILRTFQICFDEKVIIGIESRSEHFIPGKLVMTTFVFIPTDLVMVHMEDITERKQAEESLKEAELKFRTIFDYASDGILLAQSGNGKFFSANETICAMLGYTKDELLKLGVSDIHPEKSIPYVNEQLEKIRKKEILVAQNIPLLKKDRTVFFADISGSLITIGEKEYLVGIFRDITERKKTEEALLESEIKYRTLFESAGDAIFLLDKDVFIDCNQMALEMFHCTREQIIGQPPYRFSPEVQPDGRTSKEHAVEKNNAALGGQPQFFEWKHLRYDGTTFDAEISLNAVNDKGKNYIQAICRDITERKKAEEELRRYREHLEELVHERTIKLEASNKELESFSYSASHDLRAPLRSIDGFSQALLEDCEDKLDIKGKDYLIRIKAATRRMADLIEDLLQLSRITRTEMNMEKVNLTRIATFVIDELQKSQPQRHVEIKIADGLEETADLRLMRIVLENLLGNAWKFTEKKAQAMIEFGLEKKKGKNVYFIRDNGVGFDMAYADKLFAPFQRLHTEEEFPGTGIGLATVRRIIHRHGGKVWTKGQTDIGATFYFSLNEK